MAHCAAARQIKRELDEQLAATAAKAGHPLLWTAQERAVIERIQNNLDRQAVLLRDWRAAEDAKTRVKVSAELRLLETAMERMLRTVKTEAPQPRSLRSVKASRAARARWDRDDAV
jgi:hypothetical protein